MFQRLKGAPNPPQSQDYLRGAARLDMGASLDIFGESFGHSNSYPTMVHWYTGKLWL